MRRRTPSLVVLIALAVVFAAEAHAQQVSAFGVLRAFGSCTVVETDGGQIVRPADTGGLAVGARVFVEGALEPSFFNCGGIVTPLVDATVQPAFAGSGLIVPGPDGPELLAREGGRYQLSDTGGFPPGAALFVKGRVEDVPAPAPGAATLRIDVAALGAPLRTYGRLLLAPDGWRVTGPLGTVRLDAKGLLLAGEGAFVFVEGWIASGALAGGAASGDGTLAAAPGTGPTIGPGSPTAPAASALPAPAPFDGVVALRDNTTQPALQNPGVLVDDGAGGLLFVAENLLFDDAFVLPDARGLLAGKRRFVRARDLSDYDPAEPRDAPLLRDAIVGEELSGCGTLVKLADPALGAVVMLLGGGFVELQTSDAFTPGELVYVAGHVAPGPLDVPRLEHNVIAPCVQASGTLQIGFECAPVFVTDQPVGGAGSVFMLEELGGQGIGDALCTLGALTLCAPPECPFPCISANVVSDCTR